MLIFLMPIQRRKYNGRRKDRMEELLIFSQLAFTVIVGIYFVMQLRNSFSFENGVKEDSVKKAEQLNAMKRIHLSEPMTELSRPSDTRQIIGQDEGVKALRAALWGENPQHVIIYGPPGVGKTAAARVIMEEVKRSPNTPFARDAVFFEADACTMRCDERGFADPLIGSVHDPIYQGAGAYGGAGIPQPKAGAVTKAHGGILFLDEIGELPNEQLNKLLKVLEDRRVTFESSYYNKNNRKIPQYIHDIFKDGLPADFRLIGATTRKPEEIPEAIRSRCVEIYFKPLGFEDVARIVKNAADRCGVALEKGVIEMIADHSANGRDAVKILQNASNVAHMESRESVTLDDCAWVIRNGRFKRVVRKACG